MILFSLVCDSGHHFDGWFADSKGFEKQKKRKLVECPQCGSTSVDKALMAPAVSTSRSKEKTAMQVGSAMMVQALGEMRKQIESNCENVGEDFAEEARKIHYGETEERAIYGQATSDEAAELAEEGIDFTQIPWVDRVDN